jgi:magnesium transporter
VQVLHEVQSPRLQALVADGTPFWLDLVAPTEADLRAAAGALGIPPFALEDSLEFGQRAKLERAHDTALWVLHGAREREPVELHLHVGTTWLMTVRRDDRLALPEPARGAPRDRVIYEIADALVDSFLPCVVVLEAESDELEEQLLDRPEALDRRRLLDLRAELRRLRQRATPQRDLLADPAAVLEALPGDEPRNRRAWIRDLHDQLVVIVDRLEAESDALDAGLQLHLSLVQAAQNDTIERLTVIATIFLPLSVVVGFFGQNFGWLVNHISTWQAFVAYGVGGMLVSTVALVAYLRRLQRTTR